MRFSTLLSTLAVVATGASAANVRSADSSIAASLTAANFYGSPIPPWEPGHHPGWYYGKGPAPSGIAAVLSGLLCDILDLLPFCLHCPKPPHPPPPHKPPPPPEFSQTFSNLTCASQDDSFQTFGLVDTIADCSAMCDTVSGCTFFNTYHDVNGKGGSPLLTCSLFSKCLTASSADNCGGQSQPDGSIDFITNSDGFCKKKPTA
ncbi:hypothetical protein B0H15DRAFT_876813 [Mycena belliarum]|uniref:Fruit-body specific protein a n=1 Tax=Mycena belliarum TaxID=1033014 RepID=A0AAD6Y0A2_9AGAR|nr:hypothetical protein B0H15DRAFT_876813 [Mycena belliae]